MNAETQHVRNDVARVKMAVARAMDDPQWFFTKLLNFPAQKWQLDAINAVFDVRRPSHERRINKDGLCRITIRSCHGPGKTQLLAMLIHIWNFTTYGKIACTAPKAAQLTSRLLPRYRKIRNSADDAYSSNIDVLGREIICFGDRDWGANMETASEPENLAGYHDDPQLFLVDEASSKRLDPMFPVIEGALSTPGSVLVEIGNPTRVEGEFYNHHNRTGVKELYFRMHVKPEDSEFVSKQWVNDMKQKYGANSPIFLVRAAGEFASFDEAILIQPEYIDEALDWEETPDGSLPTIRISVDVADGGADSTIITASRRYKSFRQILKQKAFHFPAHVAPLEAAKAAIQMYDAFGGSFENGDSIVVDTTGVGTSTAGYLMLHERDFNVIAFKGGRSSSNPVRWRNKRVQCYLALYDAYQKGAIRFTEDAVDDEEEMRAHLLSIKRNLDNEKVDDIEPKRKILAAGLPSPDRADSLMMFYTDEEPEGLYQTFSESDIILGGSLANQASY